MHAVSLFLGLAGLAAAAGSYEHTLRDGAGKILPLAATRVPNDGNARRGQLGKRTDLSPNWCGAVQLQPPTGSKFSSVAGTWNVPKFSAPADGSGGSSAEYNLYQWVGIDGYFFNSTCDALFQAGSGYLAGGTTIEYFAWLDYYPDDFIMFNMTVTPGDELSVVITATSNQTGTVVIENLTTEQSVTTNVDGKGLGTMCQLTTEWINENAVYNDEPFAAFNTFNFTGCSAGTTTGGTEGLTGSEILYGGASLSAIRCESTIINAGELEVQYISP